MGNNTEEEEEEIQNAVIIKEALKNLSIELRNNEWEKGFHRTAKNNILPISQMDDKHLTNCIKKWEHDSRYNITPLQKELKRRKLPNLLVKKSNLEGIKLTKTL